MESRDKEALSLEHCEQCVGRRWGHRGDKRPACCACMFVRASRSGLELPRASSLTDGQGKEQTGTDSQKLGCQGGPALTGPH